MYSTSLWSGDARRYSSVQAASSRSYVAPSWPYKNEHMTTKSLHKNGSFNALLNIGSIPAFANTDPGAVNNAQGQPFNWKSSQSLTANKRDVGDVDYSKYCIPCCTSASFLPINAFVSEKSLDTGSLRYGISVHTSGRSPESTGSFLAFQAHISQGGIDLCIH